MPADLRVPRQGAPTDDAEPRSGAGAGNRCAVVVMGVAGAGKTTVGRSLAPRLDAAFIDADDLHPAANVAKMASGTPLNDADRWAWLDDVGEVLASRDRVVVACSALKLRYRDRIRIHDPNVFFVLLDAPRAVLTERLEGRINHFMQASLLDSQRADLETLAAGERGVVMDATSSAEEVASRGGVPDRAVGHIDEGADPAEMNEMRIQLAE